MEEDGSLVSHFTFGTDAAQAPSRHNTREVRLSLELINGIFEVNDNGEDPSMYVVRREQEYLDRIMTAPTKLIDAFHKKYLKPQYQVLNDIVVKCLLSTSGSLEQVSRTKLHLMVVIEDFPNRQFNWLKFIVDSMMKHTSNFLMMEQAS